MHSMQYTMHLYVFWGTIQTTVITSSASGLYKIFYVRSFILTVRPSFYIVNSNTIYFQSFQKKYFIVTRFTIYFFQQQENYKEWLLKIQDYIPGRARLFFSGRGVRPGFPKCVLANWFLPLKEGSCVLKSSNLGAWELKFGQKLRL